MAVTSKTRVAAVLAAVTAGCWSIARLLEARRRVRAAEGVAVGATSRLARNRQLGVTSAVAAARWVAHKVRGLGASPERREELEREFQIRTAEDVTRMLGDMKGALMKLGQMASYLDASLPDHVRSALAELRTGAPAMAPELAARVVEETLGEPPESLFERWDPYPIASASIGQVHRALTRDGRQVAVKVQYPGVAEAVRADLENVDLLFDVLHLLFPGMEPEPVVAELRSRLSEELDYRAEAAAQQAFADFYAGHPFIHVPRVVPELSGERVLTSEYVSGARFEEVLSWAPEERNLAAEAIYRFAFGSIYRLRRFNGDPHPGNYVFHGNGRVSFLDFGLVKVFGEEVEQFSRMIDAMVLRPDPVRFRRLVEEFGLLSPSAPVDDEEVFEYFRHFYEFVLEDRPVRIEREYASETLRRFFDPTGPHGPVMKHANLPPGFVVVQRINLGLYAIFAEMGAEANWRRIAEEIWPQVQAPPSTELGRLEAEWLARRSHSGPS
ncbi:MAG: putative ATP-binding protein [Acidimicrobiales bacterium]|nr:MAG: putative ATP-binding protein [Acidimicrobiales bacterium]